MPSKSPKQRRFMAAAANNPDFARRAGIPQSVAREFHDADRARMYEGGLAPMQDIIQRGFAPELGFQEGGTVEGKTMKQLAKELGGGIGAFIRIAKGIEEGKYYHDKSTGLIYPPQPTILHPDSGIPPTRTPGYDPYYGRGPGSVPPRGGGGRRGGRGGGRRRPPNGGGEPPIPPRVIPPGRPPGGGLTPPPDVPDYTPPDRRAGRDTAYSQRLREHRNRVASSLGVPAGYAEGGTVTGYAEGGTAREDNPYPRGSARWKVWERKHGRDPNAPDAPKAEEAPPAAEAEEEPGFFSRLLGAETERKSRTERELEKLEENARGGYVGYQLGGYAAAPRGGVPPRMAGGMKPRVGGIPPRVDPRMMATTQPVGGLQQVTGGPGRPAPINMPVKSRPLTVPPTMMPPQGGATTDPVSGPTGGPMGGPMVPPNLRGYLQRARMMNRPRRGVPGPAGAGGAPNRVGMSDQQGGLARALQRGTGRPPMSRRQGFYR